MMTASRVSRKTMKKMGTEKTLRAMGDEVQGKGGVLGKHLEGSNIKAPSDERT